MHHRPQCPILAKTESSWYWPHWADCGPVLAHWLCRVYYRDNDMSLSWNWTVVVRSWHVPEVVQNPTDAMHRSHSGTDQTHYGLFWWPVYGFLHDIIDSLWPGDAMWRHRSAIDRTCPCGYLDHIFKPHCTILPHCRTPSRIAGSSGSIKYICVQLC